MRVLLVCMMMVFAVPVIAKVPPVPTGQSATNEERNSEQLGYATAMIAKGQQQQAIDQYLDPILARYTAAYANEKRQIYVARGTAETMMYMLMATQAKRAAVSLSAIWGDTLYTKAFALIDLGRRDEARALYEQAAAMAPLNARYLSEIGNIQQLEKDWPKALETFQKAIDATEFSPADRKASEKGRAMRGAAYALVELGRLDEADVLYKKCLVLDPGDKVAQAEMRYVVEMRAKASKPNPKT